MAFTWKDFLNYDPGPITDLYGVPIDSYVQGSSYDPGYGAVDRLSREKAGRAAQDIADGKRREAYKGQKAALEDYASGDDVNPLNPFPDQNSADPLYYSPDPVVNTIEYFDAPYAEKYGMSAETAYQEALANTAHQREMADLKAAGLNPVLTASRGSGSDVFAGSALMASTGAGSSGYSRSSAKVSGFLSELAGSLGTLLSGKSYIGNAAKNLVSLFEK